MGGEKGSSEPPKRICTINEEGDEPSGSMLLRPLAKVRLRSRNTLDSSEQPRHFKSGERLAINEDEARQSRSGIENILEVVPHIEEQLIRIYRPTANEIRNFSDEENEARAKIKDLSNEEVRAKILLLSEMSRRYQEGTLEAHEAITNVLRRASFTAAQVYEEIHARGELELSNFENAEPNKFIQRLVKSRRIRQRSIILELGPGGGEDARFLAKNVRNTHVIGVDIADNAVNRANRISESRNQRSHVNMAQGDFLYILEKLQGQPINGIYSHSTLHYSPGMVLEEKIFPMIGDVLRQKNGSFFLAMKIGKSESAHSPLQVELIPGHPDNPKIDFRSGGVFRIYPETQEDVHRLLKKSGLVIMESQVVPIVGYDRPNKTEYFVQLIARAA